MRKETSNQFSEGLISDLNPINTPKTALTDNLNGTIITYNGNEFSLQNDRGNYELKNCKLKPNYIPVGIKEHGDILYIVSYNPLDESVEVGSYPSPLQVNEIEAESDELDFGSIIKSEIIDGPKTQGYNNYSKLVTKEKYIVFNGEDYKLYPGDMYKLETGSDSPYRYEKFEYFILDEESNTHNITEEIKNPKTVDENGFSYVGWDIPGWITAKARLAKLSSAGLNIRSFYAPEIDENTREVYYDFILRLNIDDELLKERIFVDSIYQREVKFVIEISGEKPKIIDSCELSEWYSDNKIIWKSISGNMTAGKNDVITVKMTPILTEKHKDGEYTIVYDNLKQEQEFDLSKVNDKPWTAGESLYKYYVSSDKTEQRIEFVVDGPKVSSSQVDLQYRIKTIDGDYVIGNSNSWDTFPDYYGIGSNYVSIPFTEEFKKENIYILEWRFFGIDGYTRNLPSRLLITTELLTGAEKESVYDRDITMDALVEKYFKRLGIQCSSEFNAELQQVVPRDPVVKSFTTKSNKNTFVAVEETLPKTTRVDADCLATLCAYVDVNELSGMWEDVLYTSNEYVDEFNTFSFPTCDRLATTISTEINIDSKPLTNDPFEAWHIKKLSDYNIPTYDLELDFDGNYLYYTLTGDEKTFSDGIHPAMYAAEFNNILKTPFKIHREKVGRTTFDAIPCYLLNLKVPLAWNVSLPGTEDDVYLYCEGIVFPDKSVIIKDPNSTSQETRMQLLEKFEIVYGETASKNYNSVCGEVNSNSSLKLDYTINVTVDFNKQWNAKWANSTYEDFLAVKSQPQFIKSFNFTYQNAEILDNWIKETNSNINESVAAKQLTELKQSLVYKDFIAGKNTLGAHVLEDEFYTPLAEAITEGIEKEHTNRGFYIQYPTYTDINGTITVGSESIDTIGFNLGALLWSF